MVYSVYNPQTKRYDYFQSREPFQEFAPTMKLAPRSELGVVWTDAMWRLPSGAKYIGSGQIAKGAIAAGKGQGGLGGTIQEDLAGFVIVGVALAALVLFP